MGIDRDYDEWAATYDLQPNLTRDLDQEVTKEVLGGFRAKSILEIGCGTGKNTGFLSSLGEHVQAFDFSTSMLSKAKERTGLSNVTFERADLRVRWPISSHSVELVACNLVLEHLEDLSFVFSEAFRSLVPGGRFFVSELHPFRQYGGSRARIRLTKGARDIDAFVHHISEFFMAGAENGFECKQMREWWHEEDQGHPPRIVSFLFQT